METKFPEFVHLHVHSHFSMLDGMSKIPDIVAKIKKDGQTAVALTDHGVMHGAIEFYEECLKNGIKPIIGVEAYIAPRTLHDKQPRIDNRGYHLVLLAKNFEGYQNLMKLTTIAHLEGYYYKPRIDKETLRKHSAGLIASSACVQGEIPRKALESYEEGRKAVLEYLEIFGPNDLVLEVQHHPNTVPDQAKANKLIFKLADEFGLKVIATNDPHYVNSDDNIAQDALLCLQTGKLVSDSERMKMTGDDYSILTREQMFTNFKDHPEVMTNTSEVAEMCNLEIELGKFKFPEFPTPVGETYETYLKKLIEERLPNRIKNVTPEIRQRLDYEFKVIKDKGYIGYFLIIQDFFQWAKDQGIPTNVRGSAAGCLVSYALGITAKQLNPFDYNLPFERFLNPFRPSAPDIDCDIADSGRDAIIHYVSEKYGHDRVAQIITFGTMAARMAVRDVGRVLGMSYGEVDTIAKLIPPIRTDLKKALETVPELKSLYDSDAGVQKCLDIAKKLEGVVRHASVHAAGVVISPGEITNYTPVMMDAKGERLITQYEMHAVGEDSVGLIKIDFLGLANLSIIQNVIRIVRKTRGIEVILDEIPLDDKKAFQLLSRGETIGVFQLESEGMRKHIKDLRPSTIDDIMAMVALYRPGPMAFIPEYIARKHNPSRIKYADPRMKKFLAKSLGLIVYQDDVLMIAIELAGYNWAEVDKFRKAIGKKIVKEMAAQKEKFFTQIIERGMKKEVAEDIWTQIETFAGYGFNKAHAASYGLVAYQTAYLKSNYPPEYMSALMTSNKDDLDKLAMEIDECKRMNIEVMAPNINESFVDFGVVKDSGNIRFGLSAIKNVGTAVAEEIVLERKNNGNYKDLKDFLVRLSGKVINKKSFESLVMAGALSDFGERNQFLFNCEKILLFANNLQKIKNNNQDSLFGGDNGISEAVLELDRAPAAAKKQVLSWERELLGMYISEHPLSEIKELVEKNCTHKLNEITTEKDNQFVRVCGVITSVQKVTTRSNTIMKFAKIEDLTGNGEFLVFPKVLDVSGDLIVNDKAVVVDGFISFKDGALKILAENIYELKDDPPRLGETGGSIPKFEPRDKKKNWGDKGKVPSTEYRVPSDSSAKSNFTLGTRNSELATIKDLTLIIPSHFTKTEMLELKELLSAHTGESAVTLQLSNADGSTKNLKIKNRINLDPVLKHKLTSMLGKESIS
ncbi:MAG TPA: DNA polymerase III subunit alpha [Patescibacteria group bacterium]|nr:DNA polymerase III subunit alpha [Patescibacteria group bacterium]